MSKKTKRTKELSSQEPITCMCGKCGEEKIIACFVDGVPWCGDCFISQSRVIDGKTGEVLS